MSVRRPIFLEGSFLEAIRFSTVLTDTDRASAARRFETKSGSRVFVSGISHLCALSSADAPHDAQSDGGQWPDCPYFLRDKQEAS